VIEDVIIEKFLSDTWLHRLFPSGVVERRTLLFHNDPNIQQFFHADNPKGFSADMLEKVWRIDKDTTKRTLGVKTQLSRNEVTSKLSRNLETNDRMLRLEESSLIYTQTSSLLPRRLVVVEVMNVCKFLYLTKAMCLLF